MRTFSEQLQQCKTLQVWLQQDWCDSSISRLSRSDGWRHQSVAMQWRVTSLWRWRHWYVVDDMTDRAGHRAVDSTVHQSDHSAVCHSPEHTHTDHRCELNCYAVDDEYRRAICLWHLTFLFRVTPYTSVQMIYYYYYYYYYYHRLHSSDEWLHLPPPSTLSVPVSLVYFFCTSLQVTSVPDRSPRESLGLMMQHF